MIESPADLAAFFSADEFATVAVIAGVGAVSGIIDSAAESDRPGGNARSGSSTWIVGAADFSVTRLQFTAPWPAVSGVVPECDLSIAAGPYAGTYRVKDIQRDGEICRLILNAR